MKDTIRVRIGRPSEFYLNGREITGHNAFNHYRNGMRFGMIPSRPLPTRGQGPEVDALTSRVPSDVVSEIQKFVPLPENWVAPSARSIRSNRGIFEPRKKISGFNGGHQIAYLDANDRPHRIGGSALTTYYSSGQIREDGWYVNGKKHRIGGPALTTYHHNGQIETEQWWIRGENHRDGDEPAVIAYYDDGTVLRKVWYVDGRKHRENGAARLGWYKSGLLGEEEWYKNGSRHRMDGPAEIGYAEVGGGIREYFWVDNIELSRLPD